MSRLGALVRLLGVVVVAGTGAAATITAITPDTAKLVTAHHWTVEVPDFKQLSLESIMYAADGSEIARFDAGEKRTVLTAIGQVPQVVIDAVLATEDAGFYRHKGVSLRSILRASLANVAAGATTQGGSTITQQLVKNGLVGDERTGQRKIREAMLALQIEKRLTKDEILLQYLNTIYFGNGAYGLAAAALTYFDKQASQLDLPDAAFLAGLIRSPSGYDPFLRPDRARLRREQVLRRMADLELITPAQVDIARAVPIPVKPYTPEKEQKERTYFVDAAKQALLDDPRLGATAQDRYDALFRGGLKIYTTLDPTMQAQAEAARDEQFPQEARDKGLAAALVAIEPSTGRVKAMVGGNGFNVLQYNVAVKSPGRQPGSTFKTFALVAALEAGARPDDVIDGTSPCVFPNKPGPDYRVASAGLGVAPLTQQTSRSINCAFLRLGQSVGITRVADTARRMGITAKMDDNPISLPIGTVEATPLDMASAYGVLANDGVRQAPFLIDRVVDRDGNVLFAQATAPGPQVIAKDVARRATQILRGVVTGGTGRAANFKDRPVAGKTGTTDDYTNAWFVGYTPQLVTAVWMGDPSNNTTQMRGIAGEKTVTGGTFPARIWHAFMARALEGQPVVDFPQPENPPARKAAARIIAPGVDCPFSTNDPNAALPPGKTTTTTIPDPAAPTTVPIVVTYKPYKPPVPKTKPGDPPIAANEAPLVSVPIAGIAVFNCRTGPPKTTVPPVTAAPAAPEPTTTLAPAAAPPPGTTPAQP